MAFLAHFGGCSGSQKPGTIEFGSGTPTVGVTLPGPNVECGDDNNNGKGVGVDWKNGVEVVNMFGAKGSTAAGGSLELAEWWRGSVWLLNLIAWAKELNNTYKRKFNY